MHIYHAACNVTCIQNHPVLLVCVSRLPLPTHVLCVARRRARNSLGNRVEQEPPLVVAVVVRRQLERRAAVERVVRLLLRVLDQEVGGRRTGRKLRRKFSRARQDF